jgi:hypothetical protein
VEATDPPVVSTMTCVALMVVELTVPNTRVWVPFLTPQFEIDLDPVCLVVVGHLSTPVSHVRKERVSVPVARSLWADCARARTPKYTSLSGCPDRRVQQL